MSTATIKIPSALLEAARDEAALQDRSISGQVSHWMRIGRAIERSDRFSFDQVRDVLAGEQSPDALTADEQTAWFALIDEQINLPDSDIDRAFAALGETSGAAGYDEDDQLVIRP